MSYHLPPEPTIEVIARVEPDAEAVLVEAMRAMIYDDVPVDVQAFIDEVNHAKRKLAALAATPRPYRNHPRR